MSNLRDAIVRMALRRPYLYLLVTLVISIVLMEVLVEIAEHTFIKPALQQLELQFIAYVQQFVTPPLTAEVMLVTASGSSTFYLLASALVCCWYLYSRQKDRLYLYLVCLCGGGILNQVLKRIFERVRPDIFPVIAESGYSFPSGHAMGAICFYGILAYFAGLGLRSKPLRWGLMAAAGIYILLIGLSRVYLGVHYPTDILAGYAAGAEVGVGLRRLKADAVGKFIAAPVLARLIDMIVYPGIGRNKIQDLMGILRALPQVLRHGADILHHSLRIGKHIAVDALENIGVPVVRLDLIGAVDVAVAVFLAGDRSAADGEVGNGWLHAVCSLQSSIILSFFPCYAAVQADGNPHCGLVFLVMRRNPCFWQDFRRAVQEQVVTSTAFPLLYQDFTIIASKYPIFDGPSKKVHILSGIFWAFTEVIPRCRGPACCAGSHTGSRGT